MATKTKTTIEDIAQEFFDKFGAGEGFWKVYTEGRVSPTIIWKWFKEKLKANNKKWKKQCKRRELESYLNGWDDNETLGYSSDRKYVEKQQELSKLKKDKTTIEDDNITELIQDKELINYVKDQKELSIDLDYDDGTGTTLYIADILEAQKRILDKEWRKKVGKAIDEAVPIVELGSTGTHHLEVTAVINKRNLRNKELKQKYLE